MTKVVALIATMSALGNALGLLGIRLPSAPGATVEFHLSALPALLLAVAVGPVPGAVTGALSTIVATAKIGNVLIPPGNFILAGLTGFFANKLKLQPALSGALAMIPYSPWVWMATWIYGVPPPIRAFIIVKAFIEVLICGVLIELILSRPEVRDYLRGYALTRQ